MKDKVFCMWNLIQKIWRLLNDRYIFYRRLVVIERHIEKKQSMIGSNIKKSEFSAKRVMNINGLLETKIKKALLRMDFHPPFDIKEAKRRLKDGYFFIILEHNGEVIGWSWAAVNSIYIPEIEKEVNLGNRTAFSFNTYINKHYRNKGLNRLLFQMQLKSLSEEHFSIIWGLIYSWNENSIKSLTAMGWEITARYYYLKFIFIKIRYRSDLN